VAVDKSVDYNSRGLSWHSKREVLEHTFRMHSFSFKWSFAEMAPTVAGLGYEWVVEQTGKSLKELIKLTGAGEQEAGLFSTK
jgi:adenine-specific DNA methylase